MYQEAQTVTEAERNPIVVEEVVDCERKTGEQYQLGPQETNHAKQKRTWYDPPPEKRQPCHPPQEQSLPE